MNLRFIVLVTLCTAADGMNKDLYFTKIQMPTVPVLEKRLKERGFDDQLIEQTNVLNMVTAPGISERSVLGLLSRLGPCVALYSKKARAAQRECDEEFIAWAILRSCLHDYPNLLKELEKKDGFRGPRNDVSGILKRSK